MRWFWKPEIVQSRLLVQEGEPTPFPHSREYPSKLMPYGTGWHRKGGQTPSYCHSELVEESPAFPVAWRSFDRLRMTDCCVIVWAWTPYGTTIGGDWGSTSNAQRRTLSAGADGSFQSPVRWNSTIRSRGIQAGNRFSANLRLFFSLLMDLSMELRRSSASHFSPQGARLFTLRSSSEMSA